MRKTARTKINSKSKCIIILSSKSAGSSALQNLLTKSPLIRRITKTRHRENETLYWTKAASILGMPQIKMLDSEVPLSREKAQKDLMRLLKDNLDSYFPPQDDEELVFEGWRLLCRKYSPVFLEKSPHHLIQWSSLELMLTCVEKLQEIDFLFIGLVRNPLDTMYSVWKRWRTIPEKLQDEWLIAYKNLLKFKQMMDDKLIIMKYEDIVNNSQPFIQISDFIGSSKNEFDTNYLHGRSILKWKNDRLFGFRPSEEVIQLAETFGYKRSELINKGSLFWPVYKYLSRSLFKMSSFSKLLLRSSLKRFPKKRGTIGL